MASDKVSVTFKLDEEVAHWLGKTAFKIDRGKSEVIRACILLALPTVKNFPDLIDNIKFKNRNGNNT